MTRNKPRSPHRTIRKLGDVKVLLQLHSAELDERVVKRICGILDTEIEALREQLGRFAAQRAHLRQS